MLPKFLTSQTKTITGAAIVLGAASFVSRLIGIVRDRTFAHLFGAGDTLDAYYAAFRIPDFIYNLLIIGALSAGFIPIFVKLIEKNKDEAWEVVNSVINTIAIALGITSAILFVFTPTLMHWIVPGFSGEKLHTTILLTRIMLLSPILHGISTVVGGVIQSFKHFIIYSLAPIVYNTSIILGAVFLVPFFGTAGLAIGVVVGALLHLSVQLPVILGHGYQYKPGISWGNQHVRAIGRLMVPRTLALGIQQLNWMVLITLASTLGSGRITVFTFADNLQYAPVGIIGVSYAMAAFPIIAGYLARGETDKVRHQITSTVKQILFFVIPITIMFILLRAQIVRAVLGTGRFDWEDTVLTMNTLAMFSISLFAQCLTPLITRTFFNLEDTWTPLGIGFISATINVILALFFRDLYGIQGMALSFSIAAMVQFSLLWIFLRAKLGGLHEKHIIASLFKISIAAFLMAITIQGLKQPIAELVDMTKLWGIFLQGFIAGGAGLIIYGLVNYILKLDEMMAIKESMTRKFLRTKSVVGDVGGEKHM